MMTRMVPELDETIDLYPTRKVANQQLSARKDPVVYGTAGTGPLGEDQLRHYEKDGYLFFPGCMSGRDRAWHTDVSYALVHRRLDRDIT